jgi:hypothetical protein
MKSPTITTLKLCLPQLLVDPCQPLVLTVRQTLLLFSHLLLVNWSSHQLTSSVKTWRKRDAFKPVAPPTQIAAGRPGRKHQSTQATAEVASSLCKLDEIAVLKFPNVGLSFMEEIAGLKFSNVGLSFMEEIAGLLCPEIVPLQFPNEIVGLQLPNVALSSMEEIAGLLCPEIVPLQSPNEIVGLQLPNVALSSMEEIAGLLCPEIVPLRSPNDIAGLKFPDPLTVTLVHRCRNSVIGPTRFKSAAVRVHDTSCKCHQHKGGC